MKDQKVRANQPTSTGTPSHPLTDPDAEPGYVLLGLGLAALVLAIAAAGYTLFGWTAAALAASAAVIIGGLGWVVYERGVPGGPTP